MARILIVDDDPMLCTALEGVLSGMGHATDSAHTLASGLEAARKSGPEIIILDVGLPDGNGLAAIAEFRETSTAPEVIILTGDGDPDSAEQAIRSGAWSYITKPPGVNDIRLPVKRALQYRRSHKPSGAHSLKRHGIVGKSRPMKHCLGLAAKAAATEASVLIQGDTGTGKELFARAIHNNSRRATGPFVVVDCAALPENLVESMLFGHEKGAFTGADRQYKGLVRQADGGTLFLDEVGELSRNVQRAFLRVLQDRRFRPVGGVVEVESNFRLVAATNRNLDDLVADGLFREDLLFRLRSIAVKLPPLSARTGDVQVLAEYFLERFCDRQGIVRKGMASDFREALGRYDWPGNVRELMGAMESSLAQAEGEPNLMFRHLPTHIRAAVARASVEPRCGPCPAWTKDAESFPTLKAFREERVAEAERLYLGDLMIAVGWDVSKARKIAGLSRARMYAVLRRHGLKRG